MWSDRADDPPPAKRRRQRPAPTDGLLTGRYWREVADRAIKTAAQAVLIYWGGGDVLNLWQVDWLATAGFAAGGAAASLLTSIGSAPFGDRYSPSAIRVAPLGGRSKTPRRDAG